MRSSDRRAAQQLRAGAANADEPERDREHGRRARPQLRRQPEDERAGAEGEARHRGDAPRPVAVDADADEEAAVDLIQTSTLLLHKARPHAWTQWADNAGVSRPKSTDVIYVDSMFALARAAERGVGIALLPLPVSQDWLDNGALVALHSKYLVTEDYYWITINGNPNQRKSCLLFFQWMLRTFQKEE